MPPADVEAALRAVFPRDTIEFGEGYMGHVHVKIVSAQFNGKSEEDKQTFVWDILRDALGEDAQGVSLVIPYATEEL